MAEVAVHRPIAPAYDVGAPPLPETAKRLTGGGNRVRVGCVTRRSLTGHVTEDELVLEASFLSPIAGARMVGVGPEETGRSFYNATRTTYERGRITEERSEGEATA